MVLLWVVPIEPSCVWCNRIILAQGAKNRCNRSKNDVISSFGTWSLSDDQSTIQVQPTAHVLGQATNFFYGVALSELCFMFPQWRSLTFENKTVFWFLCSFIMYILTERWVSKLIRCPVVEIVLLQYSRVLINSLILLCFSVATVADVRRNCPVSASNRYTIKICNSSPNK